MTAESISNMSIEEKISTIEMLWDDLCQHQKIDTPDWHQDVLQAREEKHLADEQQPMDWSEAKKHILKTRNELRKL
jgi:Putative addiction module component